MDDLQTSTQGNQSYDPMTSYPHAYHAEKTKNRGNFVAFARDNARFPFSDGYPLHLVDKHAAGAAR